MDVEEIHELYQIENSVAGQRIINYRRAFVSLLFALSCIGLLFTYMSVSIDVLRSRYDYKTFFDYLIYFLFMFGTIATENKGNYSFFYQCIGFLIIFILCILERKAQIWLRDKTHIMNIEEVDLTNEHIRTTMYPKTIREVSSLDEESSFEEAKRSESSCKNHNTFGLNVEKNQSFRSEDNPFLEPSDKKVNFVMPESKLLSD